MLHEYLPVLLQIVVAILFAASALFVSILVGKRYCVRMRDDSSGRRASEIQRQVLSRGDALYPFRYRDCFHVSVGSGLQRRDQTERSDLLEYAQFHHDLDGRLCLRAQKRRARFQEIAQARPSVAASLLATVRLSAVVGHWPACPRWRPLGKILQEDLIATNKKLTCMRRRM